MSFVALGVPSRILGTPPDGAVANQAAQEVASQPLLSAWAGAALSGRTASALPPRKRPDERPPGMPPAGHPHKALPGREAGARPPPTDPRPEPAQAPPEFGPRDVILPARTSPSRSTVSRPRTWDLPPWEGQGALSYFVTRHSRSGRRRPASSQIRWRSPQ